MLPSERRRAIAAAVTAGVRTEDLAARFEVSAETIRRDLIRLQQDGLLHRVHGGAEPTERPRADEANFVTRQTLHLPAKRAIAALAAGLVEPGHTVLLDVGTTALEVARAIADDWRGTVVTNSLLVCAELAARPSVQVISLGGRVRPGDLAGSGPQAVAALSELYADLAFLGSGGLHAEAGLTDYHSDEIDLRRLMITHSARSYVLADRTKFGIVAARAVCDLTALDAVISDAPPDATLTQALKEADVDVLTP